MPNVVREDVVRLSFDVNDTKLNKAKGSLDQMRKSVGGVDDSQIQKTTRSTEMLGNMAQKAGGLLSSVARVSFKALTAGITGSAVAMGALTKQAVAAYADYEQLVGGVETLFGAGGNTVEEYAQSVGKSVDEISDKYNTLIQAQTDVMNNADEAFKSCGLSANEYMETVTSFSASLVSSLGGDTVKAAETANQALMDMSDNANKMGTDMSTLQYAYQSFARQQYMLLDNLKLGKPHHCRVNKPCENGETPNSSAVGNTVRSTDITVFLPLLFVNV